MKKPKAFLVFLFLFMPMVALGWGNDDGDPRGGEGLFGGTGASIGRESSNETDRDSAEANGYGQFGRAGINNGSDVSGFFGGADSGGGEADAGLGDAGIEGSEAAGTGLVGAVIGAVANATNTVAKGFQAFGKGYINAIASKTDETRSAIAAGLQNAKGTDGSTFPGAFYSGANAHQSSKGITPGSGFLAVGIISQGIRSSKSAVSPEEEAIAAVIDQDINSGKLGMVNHNSWGLSLSRVTPPSSTEETEQEQHSRYGLNHSVAIQGTSAQLNETFSKAGISRPDGTAVFSKGTMGITVSIADDQSRSVSGLFGLPGGLIAAVNDDPTESVDAIVSHESVHAGDNAVAVNSAQAIASGTLTPEQQDVAQKALDAALASKFDRHSVVNDPVVASKLDAVRPGLHRDISRNSKYSSATSEMRAFTRAPVQSSKPYHERLSISDDEDARQAAAIISNSKVADQINRDISGFVNSDMAYKGY